MFAGILDGGDLAFDAAVAEAARNQDAAHIAETARSAFSAVTVSESIHLMLTCGMVGNAAVLQGFHNGDVGVMKLDIFADQGDGHSLSVG